MNAKKVVVLDWPDALEVLDKNDAEPKDSKNIKNADGKKVDNGFNWKRGKKGGYLNGAVKARSLKDMVKKRHIPIHILFFMACADWTFFFKA